MATYCITYSPTKDWNDDKREQFKTRTEADRRVAEVQALGRFARLIRWEGNEPVKEVLRINEDAQPTEE